MNARDYTAVTLLNKSDQTTTTSGSATDMATYANVANREVKAIYAILGITTITTATIAITECATTNGTFTAPAHGTATVTVTANGVGELHFRNDLRYLKATVTVNGNGLYNAYVAVIGLRREANS